MAEVVIVGAGPAGVMTAVYLAKQDYMVTVLEKREAPTRDTIDQRTVVYGINACGQQVLKQAGVQLSDQTSLRRMSYGTWDFSDGKGNVVRAPETLQPSLMVERSTLAAFMIEEAKRLFPDRISWYICVNGLAPQGGYWDLSSRDHTTVRMVTCWRPPKVTAIVWPNGKGEISGVFFSTKQNLQNMVNDNLAVEEQLIGRLDPTLPRTWIAQIADQLKGAKASCAGASTKCSTIKAPGAVLVGDSAHGVRPTMGLGCNTALQSAQLLAQAVQRCKGDFDAAVDLYERERLPDVHALHALDVTALPRLGGGRGGVFNPWFLLTRWHLALWTGPLGALGGPELRALGQEQMSYRKVWSALQRDGVIAAVCIAASACLLGSLAQAFISRSRLPTTAVR
ncbi:hypothetical protein WJX73_010481 [Symbiochloris irregularis]|uniref:FAD-binding domain-containing protein n=1 Tax=Symbiochloris irregularis TaxID=706552 RepID=A0AAW1P0L7_9CHLO